MRILIVTPLFPPDTAPSALYTKELARHLSSEHEVSVLLFGHLPEGIPDVKFHTVDKRRFAPLRIWSFMYKLQTCSWWSDVILIQNGPSVELPAFFTLQFKRRPVILMESDPPALERSLAHPIHHQIHKQLRQLVAGVFTKDELWPNDQPLIHPLKPKPEKELHAWEISWENHLKQLMKLIKDV